MDPFDPYSPFKFLIFFIILVILSSPVDRSTVEDGTDVAFIEVLNCSPPTGIANSYINNPYFICSLATWGKYKGNTQSTIRYKILEG